MTIPIHYTHIPKEVALSDSLPEKMTLKIADKGTAFLRYYLNRDMLSVEVNLTNLPINKSSYTIERADMLSYVQDVFSSTAQITTFKPETLQIKYSPLTKKELPIVVGGKISAAGGYIFTDSLRINPPTVWVYGSKKALDTLTVIKTAPAKQENIRKNIDLTLYLKSPKGTRLSEEKVKITGEVEEYTEKKFELPIACYNIPDDMHVRFFPSTVDVVCQVALSKYSQLTENDLKVRVDYNDLSSNQSMVIISSLYEKPQWLINYRIVPEAVEYLIEQKRSL